MRVRYWNKLKIKRWGLGPQISTSLTPAKKTNETLLQHLPSKQAKMNVEVIPSAFKSPPTLRNHGILHDFDIRETQIASFSYYQNNYKT